MDLCSRNPCPRHCITPYFVLSCFAGNADTGAVGRCRAGPHSLTAVGGRAVRLRGGAEAGGLRGQAGGAEAASSYGCGALDSGGCNLPSNQPETLKAP